MIQDNISGHTNFLVELIVTFVRCVSIKPCGAYLHRMLSTIPDSSELDLVNPLISENPKLSDFARHKRLNHPESTVNLFIDPEDLTHVKLSEPGSRVIKI